MKKIIQKPHLFFFALVPAALILGFIFKSQSFNVDYLGGQISIGYWNIFVTSTVFFMLIGINYFSLVLTNKKAKKWLTLFHVAFQILALILFVFYIIKTDSTNTIELQSILNLTLFIAFFIFLASVIIHLFNFILSLISKSTK